MDDITTVYCSIDDFWIAFKEEWDKHLLETGSSNRGPDPILSPSEMMTIFILFHQSNYRTFKHFYQVYICTHLRKEFPKLISYSRFVHLMKNLIIPLFAYLLQNRGEVTGISFIDSTKLQVCHNKRIPRNKVFKKTGIILVDIDPLELVQGIRLKCFGEIYQERLYRYLKIFLNRTTEG